MKTTRKLIVFLILLLFAVPVLGAQDLSKYRKFSLGAKLPAVLKLTDQKLPDVTPTHGTLFQELTWWPPSALGTSLSPNSVEEIIFSFYNGDLYKISVTYDQSSTEGLTAADMVESISAKYGPPLVVAADAYSKTGSSYESRPRSVATWENSEYSFDLIRSTFTDRFGLIISSKRLSAAAQLADVAATKQEAQEGPQREADRQKKELDDREIARQKNRKTFRP